MHRISEQSHRPLAPETTLGSEISEIYCSLSLCWEVLISCRSSSNSSVSDSSVSSLSASISHPSASLHNSHPDLVIERNSVIEQDSVIDPKMISTVL